MTLEEVRNEIDEIDTNMKPLFFKKNEMWKTCCRSKRTERRRCICSRKRT